MLLDARNESVRDDYDALMYAAWHTAVLTNAGSKIPPLSKLLRREPDPTEIKDDDDDDQIAAKRMMAAFMGAAKTKSMSKAPA